MTSGVAWYGAIVATVGLVIAVYVAWRDRPRVVVYGVRGYGIPGSGAFSPDNPVRRCHSFRPTPVRHLLVLDSARLVCRAQCLFQ
jgi:hypothetical protein